MFPQAIIRSRQMVRRPRPFVLRPTSAPSSTRERTTLPLFGDDPGTAASRDVIGTLRRDGFARPACQAATGAPLQHLQQRLHPHQRCVKSPDRPTLQNRPIDRVYPVIFIDAIEIKIRDGQVTNRPVYCAIGVTVDGKRDILGLWIGSGGEGAKSWRSPRPACCT